VNTLEFALRANKPSFLGQQFGSCYSPVPLAEVIRTSDVHAFLEEWVEKGNILWEIPM